MNTDTQTTKRAPYYRPIRGEGETTTFAVLHNSDEIPLGYASLGAEWGIWPGDYDAELPPSRMLATVQCPKNQAEAVQALLEADPGVRSFCLVAEGPVPAPFSLPWQGISARLAGIA